MSRDVPFDREAICDECGKIGAYDFMGDYLCSECSSKMLKPEYEPTNNNESKQIEVIESLLDLNDEEIATMHRMWDKGDCSIVGITEIFLYQCIKKHKQENGEYYDTDYDKIVLRYKKFI